MTSQKEWYKGIGRLLHFLRPHGEERWVAAATFVVFVVLNALQVMTRWTDYSKASHVGFFTVYTKKFLISGYDAWSCVYLSNGAVYMETTRHPLYLVWLVPLSWLNRWVMHTFGISLAAPIMAVCLLMAVMFSAVFFFRMLRSVLGLRLDESAMLTALLLSMAHVMVPQVCPDHFAFSMAGLILALYLSVRALMSQQPIRTGQLAPLNFILTGMAPTNGIKVLMGAWLINGRGFFRRRFFLKAVVLPVLLIGALWTMAYFWVERPAKAMVERRDLEREAKLMARHDTAFFNARARHNAWRDKNRGESVGQGSTAMWTDLTSSRTLSLWHNVFGESLMLHRDFLLHDALIDRPMFVGYRSWVNPMVEVCLVVLFLGGIIVCWRHAVVRLLLTWLSVDIGLHLVLGFALNEVHIMTSGWAFALPTVYALLLLRLPQPWRRCLGWFLGAITLFLFVWNAGLLSSYLLARN